MTAIHKRKYMLVIKRKHNDYLPLEWNLLKSYNGDDLTTLEGIDNFTKGRSKAELIEEILEENMVDGNEFFQEFSIIYFENNRYRELKDGPIFNLECNALDSEYIVNMLSQNFSNKNFLNDIYNMVDENSSNEFIEFVFVIKNISFIDETVLKRILFLLNRIPYGERRHLSLLIFKKNKVKKLV